MRDQDAALRTELRPDALVAFGNRLAKNHRHWSRWARRHGYGAFRCYDRDLPEFPLAIDVYVPAEASAGAHLHVQELDTGWVQTDAQHEDWVRGVARACAQACAIPEERVVLKLRSRRRAGEQHQATGVAGREFAVMESGLKFWVNLEAYLDTGLFPDHRAMRAMVRERASGARMLNLFAYTGSFTVYAAAGGAASTVSIDLSSTYLAWAARNLAANACDRASNALVRADVLRWLDEEGPASGPLDLIVLDPPVFSNSKSMQGVLDIQRDHRTLIAKCRRLLARGGELYFSTNLRSFTLDPALARDRGCVDITGATAAPDYRDAKVHRAFRIAAEGRAHAR